MRFDRPMCLAASAVIATTASLWGIETSVRVENACLFKLIRGSSFHEL